MITNKREPMSYSYSYIPLISNLYFMAHACPVKYLGLLVDSKLSWSKHCVSLQPVKAPDLSLHGQCLAVASCTAKCAAQLIYCPPNAAILCGIHAHNSGDIRLCKIVKLGGFEAVLESSNQLMDHQLIRLLLPASSPIFTVKVSIRFLHDVYNECASIISCIHPPKLFCPCNLPVEQCLFYLFILLISKTQMGITLIYKHKH